MHWVPRRTVVCDRVLAEEGVAGDIVAEDYPLAWVPLDSDLLSLELPSAFQVPALRWLHLPSKSVPVLLEPSVYVLTFLDPFIMKQGRVWRDTPAAGQQ